MQQLSAKVFTKAHLQPKKWRFVQKKAKLHHQCLVKGQIYGKQKRNKTA